MKIISRNKSILKKRFKLYTIFKYYPKTSQKKYIPNIIVIVCDVILKELKHSV